MLRLGLQLASAMSPHLLKQPLKQPTRNAPPFAWTRVAFVGSMPAPHRGVSAGVGAGAGRIDAEQLCGLAGQGFVDAQVGGGHPSQDFQVPRYQDELCPP
jgi:hypothetical protein